MASLAAGPGGAPNMVVVLFAATQAGSSTVDYSGHGYVSLSHDYVSRQY